MRAYLVALTGMPLQYCYIFSNATVIAGLASGVPMVITPLFADQPDNANCLEAAGLCLSVPDADVASLRNAVVHALADDGMRERAQMAAKEIAKMATADEAVDLMLSP
jgi:UDP:flavonoid glycosyltransferase YjiC (YdhE family)